MPARTPKAKNQGEGDYISARRFQEEERSFVRSGQVERRAREAADALDGPEGAELEEARKASARGKSLRQPRPGKPAEPDAEVERRLDEGLEETFPASDPVSINPGSN